MDNLTKPLWQKSFHNSPIGTFPLKSTYPLIAKCPQSRPTAQYTLLDPSSLHIYFVNAKAFYIYFLFKKYYVSVSIYIYIYILKNHDMCLMIY